jgi:hypothetical protein
MPRRASSDEQSSRPISLADGLVRDFGRGSDLAKRSIRTLYATLDACHSARVEDAFARWSQATACTGAAADHRADAAWSQLAAGYGLPVEGLRPERLLFVLQTYYAMVVQRLLAGFQASLEGRESADAAGASFSPEPVEFDWYLDAQDATVAAMLAELVDRLRGHARRIVAAEAEANLSQNWGLTTGKNAHPTGTVGWAFLPDGGYVIVPRPSSSPFAPRKQRNFRGAKGDNRRNIP